MQTVDEKTIDKKPLLEILKSAGQISHSDLIPLLQQIQDSYGYLPPNILAEASRLTNIPASKIYGVSTFYEQFHLEPHGRHTIRCCRGTACHVKGGLNIIRAIQKILGIEPEMTTEDMRFTFETVACLGTCFLAPVMIVDNDYYGHLTTQKIKKIVDSYS
jgi:NADH-quinone oxidoreductase subunit E